MKIGKYIDGLYGVESNLDLISLRKTAGEMYDIIKDQFESDHSDFNGHSTLTTQLFSKYNLLMYPFPIIHDLYFAISEAFHLSYYAHYKRKVTDNFFIQCWLNYYKKGEYINWHDHQPMQFNAWHGFVCVDVEPNSYTSYKWEKDPSRKGLILDVPSKDGLIIMGLSNGDVHRSSEWHDENRPRITIAFDIIPGRCLCHDMLVRYPEPKYLNAMKETAYYVNHWIPI